MLQLPGNFYVHKANVKSWFRQQDDTVDCKSTRKSFMGLKCGNHPQLKAEVANQNRAFLGGDDHSLHQGRGDSGHV